MEKKNIKVSVVVPIYNVEKYLRECLDSLIHQTFQDIEIICVNDGSTDSSGDIIAEYAAKDPRVVVISKKNTGYGNSMNVGFDAASGEYIGIVESDDYAEPDMFEKLYQRAKENELDVLKSSYYFYFSRSKVRNEKQTIVSPVLAGKTICPTTFFKAKMEEVEFFNIKPTIWSSIYRRAFIRENDIRFNETPGASYQDASFNFKVWICAQRVQLIRDAYLHYRQDNENSSVNSKGKVFCVCDEYAEMERFLKRHPLQQPGIEPVKNRIKFDSYMWNYERLAVKYKYLFIERAAEEFREDMEQGTLDRTYFESYKWEALLELINDPVMFHTRRMCEGAISASDKEYQAVIHSRTYRIARAVMILPRKLRGGLRCVRDHGLLYTVRLAVKRILKRA